MPMISQGQMVGRVSKGVLDLALSPWITTFTPGEDDFGADGECRLTSYEPGKLIAEVYPETFRFQLKGCLRESLTPGSLKIGVGTLKWLFGHHGAVVLFHVPIDIIEATGTVYWRGVDDQLLSMLDGRDSGWVLQDSVSIPFSQDDMFIRNDRGALSSYAMAHAGRPAQEVGKQHD